jgi:hypothetical protein
MLQVVENSGSAKDNDDLKYTVPSLDVWNDKWLVAAIETPAPVDPTKPRDPWEPIDQLTSLAVYDVSESAAANKPAAAHAMCTDARNSFLREPLDRTILYLTLLLD